MSFINNPPALTIPNEKSFPGAPLFIFIYSKGKGVTMDILYIIFIPFNRCIKAVSCFIVDNILDLRTYKSCEVVLGGIVQSVVSTKNVIKAQTQ